MAERRMFAKTIVLSDEFLDMPTSTRCLYFTLGMFADDDGFVNNPKSIIRQIGASVDDMNILIGKKFVIAFEDGVIVIKHWRIHNYIQSDRKKDTKYLADKGTLFLDENKAYTQNYEHAKYLLDGTEIDVSTMDTNRIQNVSIGKDRIGKDRIGKENPPLINPPQGVGAKSEVEEIVSYLNDKIGTHYKPNTAKTVTLIKARRKEGFTVQDFKTVIDKKIKEWKGNDNMEKFLRPETLFGSKFEGYLNQIEKPKDEYQEKIDRQKEAYLKDLEEREALAREQSKEVERRMKDGTYWR